MSAALPVLGKVTANNQLRAFSAGRSKAAPVIEAFLNDCIWTPPRLASIPFIDDKVRLLTYIRPLTTASIY